DFLAFSGHKMFAMPGVGVLWVSPQLRGLLQPAIVGGGMNPEGALTDLKLPAGTLAQLMEAGTPNAPAVLSLVPAIDFIESIGIQLIEHRLRELMKCLYTGLRCLPLIDFSPGVDHCWHQSHGILSFRFTGIKTADLASVLADQNIVVRTGDHCLFQRPEGD